MSNFDAGELPRELGRKADAGYNTLAGIRAEIDQGGYTLEALGNGVWFFAKEIADLYKQTIQRLNTHMYLKLSLKSGI